MEITMFEKILSLIEKYDTVVIHRHSNPDGDALGSQIGLKNIIKENSVDFTKPMCYNSIRDMKGETSYAHT
jgi:nanoRNase/pAp phosphatase (c-di-AMP/oligoRNAs hydrolase)